MPFQLTDSSVNVQRLQFDNSGSTEIGSGTPSGALSVNGKAVLDRQNVAPVQQSARPDSMPRVSGAVNISAGVPVTVGCPQSAGFGSVNGEVGISHFDSSKTSVEIYPYFASGTRTVGYSIF
jgi:hypothetical protein